MFSEENIAAAQLAQMFGSELLNMQNKATTDSGTPPTMVKMDPKQFLVNSTNFQQQNKLREQQILLNLQREAEASHPLPLSDTPTSQPEPVSAPTPSFVSSFPQQSSNSQDIKNTKNDNELVKINETLEKIVSALSKIHETLAEINANTIKKD